MSEPYNVPSMVMALEDGMLSTVETIDFFAYLISTGLAWTLQGWYGRMARDAIRLGYITAGGQVIRYPEDDDG